MPDSQRARLELLQSSATYRDDRLAGHDAVVLMEVVEHVDPPRLPALVRSVFAHARPTSVLITTPNAEHNVRYAHLPAGSCGTPTTGSSGPASSSGRGPVPRRPPTATPCATCPSGTTTGGRPADPAGRLPEGGMTALAVPELSLVCLVGASGSGKSTFARQHFGRFEVLSSDFCRGLVSGDEDDQSATAAAFDVLHHIAGKRLDGGHLTVVDATNVQPEARRQLVALARAHDVLPVAIVLDLPERVCLDRNAARTDRDLSPSVVQRHRDQLRRSLKHLGKEGFRTVHVLHSEQEVAEAVVVRERLRSDFRDRRGPFDVVGDVHGCRAELEQLLTELGYRLVRDEQDRPVDAVPPDGRTAVFVGDLVDRGPDSPGVLRLVMGMVAAGHALCVPGNHESKLVRALQGRKVQVSHGLETTLAQLAAEPPEFRAEVERFCDGLVAHLVLDDGRLVVAHAGLKQAYHGRASGGCAASRSTATPPARPTSSGCPSATPGPRSTAARRWCSTATRRRPGPSG
jgi:predicted kinase